MNNIIKIDYFNNIIMVRRNCVTKDDDPTDQVLRIERRTLILKINLELRKLYKIMYEDKQCFFMQQLQSLYEDIFNNYFQTGPLYHPLYTNHRLKNFLIFETDSCSCEDRAKINEFKDCDIESYMKGVYDDVFFDCEESIPLLIYKEFYECIRGI